MELVNAACNFEPHESFFSLFSDPRSTRLTRIHLREDLVQDQDLEAIRKQVRPASLGMRWPWGATTGQSDGESGPISPTARSPRPLQCSSTWCSPLPKPTYSTGPDRGQGLGLGADGAVPPPRTWWSST